MSASTSNKVLWQTGSEAEWVPTEAHPEALAQQYLPRPVEDDWRPPRTSLTLPYISGLSETVRRILGPLHVRVAFRPHSTLRRQLVHPKDHVPMDQRKSVVYQVPCSECPKVYVGQSSRTLKHRLSEHRWALQNGEVAASALAEHVWSTGHQVNLSKAEVINSHPFVTTRCLLESWHIQRHPTSWTGRRGPCLESTRPCWTSLGDMD